MSRGRHSRPRAHGGGLASFLALALAGGAIAISVTHPSTNALRLCVAGVAVAGAASLLIMARLQRGSSRLLARVEERLRVLEYRSRDEGEELHRRVIDAVTREGELRHAVELLSAEIARLRGSLDGLAAPVGAVVAMAAERPEPYPAAAAGAGSSVVASPTVDIPLVQRVLAAQESLAAPSAAQAAQEGVPAEAAPMDPPAGELWLPPARPEPAPYQGYPPAAAPAPHVAQTDVRSWVVRELHVTDEPEPVAALTMRILDLTTPPAAEAADGAEEPEQPVAAAHWSSFARPA